MIDGESLNMDINTSDGEMVKTDGEMIEDDGEYFTT